MKKLAESKRQPRSGSVMVMQVPENKSSRGGPSEAWGLKPSDNPELDARERARLAERNRLIVQVMEINAKQRHYESLYLGIKLELELSKKNAASSEAVAGLEAKFKELTRALEKFVVERDFLEVALAEIDGAPVPKNPMPPSAGRA